MPQVAAIIPARYASTRFPAKALHPVAGKPLVQWVWEQCKQCAEFSRVLVATDDQRIAEVVTGFGGEYVMTKVEHASGTDRIAEVVLGDASLTHIINVQGDEPLVSPELLGKLAQALLEGGERFVTAAHPIHDLAEFLNPNAVKVVLGSRGQALYFSRSPIPYERSAPESLPKSLPAYRHYGLYGYTREFLAEFVKWPVSPLEQTEQLEQLRALEAGEPIRVVLTDERSVGVDVPGDVALVEELLAKRA
jgi:3-deoxy-manno-octulosonate cytidylyltransferase (CMP-KDO synthetase)